MLERFGAGGAYLQPFRTLFDVVGEFAQFQSGAAPLTVHQLEGAAGFMGGPIFPQNALGALLVLATDALELAALGMGYKAIIAYDLSRNREYLIAPAVGTVEL